MGQAIQVEALMMGDVALFDSDRTLTGQDGQGFSPPSDGAVTPPGELARRLFETDAEIDHVFVLSNQVTVRRRGGWEDVNLQAASEVIRDFFVFYQENRGADQAS
jgi:hypothetical protein